MPLAIRGSNPIWTEFDLAGNIFDDTYYMFVLQNTLPYIPTTVYHDPNFNVPWTNPIRFLSNGTLPNDIYFDQDVVYRLEFRQGADQSSPLIYLVENYIAGIGGSTPIDTVGVTSENQITTPQFAIIDFSSPFTQTGATTEIIDVAPGWALELTGSGNVRLEQVPLSSALANPTNAPYMLRIVLNGAWTQAYLRQRFQQNGMLWANKTVSAAITARIEGAPQNVTGILIDSNNAVLATVIDNVTINSSFNEYTGHGTLGDTTNPNLPPAAYVDYKIILPNNVDIYVSSLQLLVQDLLNIAEPTFQQDSIDRQIDHTFHNYYNSIIMQPKTSILTGWDFPLNPWQFTDIGLNNISVNQYTADQTIIIQQNYVATGSGNNIQVGNGVFSQNFGFFVSGSAPLNQFAILQYVDAFTNYPYWGTRLSALVKLRLNSTHSSTVRVKMRLIYRDGVAPTIGQNQPVATWPSGQDPTFAAGWTQIAPLNDPVYTLGVGQSTISFDQFQMPAATSGTMTLGVLFYTLNNLNATGTPDSILFDSVSLVQNDFAIEAQPQTFDQVLRECQYYYEKTYDQGILPGTANNFASASSSIMGISGQGTGSASVFAKSFKLQFKNIKRTNAPVITFYSPQNGAANNVWTVLFFAGAQLNAVNSIISNWLITANGAQGATYTGQNAAALLTHSILPANYTFAVDGLIYYHNTIDARLGLVP